MAFSVGSVEVGVPGTVVVGQVNAGLQIANPGGGAVVGTSANINA